MKRKINWRRVAMIYATCILGFAALIVGTRAFLVAGSADAPTPQFQIDGTRHDFGKVRSGKALRKTFRVSNTGTQRLILNRQSCGSCGDPKSFAPIILAPGDSKTIEITLNAAGRKGRIKRVVRFTTSDPRHPKIALAMFATVVAEGE